MDPMNKQENQNASPQQPAIPQTDPTAPQENAVQEEDANLNTDIYQSVYASPQASAAQQQSVQSPVQPVPQQQALPPQQFQRPLQAPPPLMQGQVIPSQEVVYVTEKQGGLGCIGTALVRLYGCLGLLLLIISLIIIGLAIWINF